MQIFPRLSYRITYKGELTPRLHLHHLHTSHQDGGDTKYSMRSRTLNNKGIKKRSVIDIISMKIGTSHEMFNKSRRNRVN